MRTTIISASVSYESSMAAADRLTNFDDGDEEEVHDNQDVGENRKNMRDQVDDGHGEDESVSANSDRRWTQQ
ncbi:hypothetical protein PsorP6_012315 [Peronosclerospora sorghi]|uniref:Uncharacterized protein n=1 Tax=Peronosclerospora sorghi TaxID=230839 RepID=A0ACC0WHQ6_9STRA|nr:hypothetical protein PsorP6_012315 [Peronosclerospora sorghi]